MYTFILWAVICGFLFLWVLGRKLFPLSRVTTPSKEQLLEDSRPKQNSFYRFGTAAKAFGRRHLLPESLTGFFGHTTRLQIGILTIIIAYLTIFTFVGITYKVSSPPCLDCQIPFADKRRNGSPQSRIALVFTTRELGWAPGQTESVFSPSPLPPSPCSSPAENHCCR
jgi:hypothetical protein